ncbi:MAG: hypothetical protein ACYS47_11100 [Planctomycetota bacterium]|jgi:hypothetical protein
MAEGLGHVVHPAPSLEHLRVDVDGAGVRGDLDLPLRLAEHVHVVGLGHALPGGKHEGGLHRESHGRADVVQIRIQAGPGLAVPFLGGRRGVFLGVPVEEDIEPLLVVGGTLLDLLRLPAQGGHEDLVGHEEEQGAHDDADDEAFVGLPDPVDHGVLSLPKAAKS